MLTNKTNGTRSGRVQTVTRPELEPSSSKRLCPLCGVTSTPKGIVDVRDAVKFGGHCTACGYTYNNRGSSVLPSYTEAGNTAQVDATTLASKSSASPLVLTFSFSDFAKGYVDMATAITAGKTITKAVVSVTTAFSAGASMSVGTLTEPTKLMAKANSDLTYVAEYIVEPALTILADTTLRMYFTGTPTAGSAQLKVYCA